MESGFLDAGGPERAFPPSVLLAALVLSVWFGLGTPGSAPTPDPAAPSPSLLPTTQPGLSAEEGVFLVTPTDDGSDAIYFIAQNMRHSTSPGDLQHERELNPLWPLWIVDRDVVLAFPEAAAVGAARIGLLDASGTADARAAAEPAPIPDAESAPAEAPVVPDDAPAAAEPSLPADAEAAAADAPAMADGSWTAVEPSLDADDQGAAADAPVANADASAPAAASVGADDVPTVAEPVRIGGAESAAANAPVADADASASAEASVVADDASAAAEASAIADDAPAAGDAPPVGADASAPIVTDLTAEIADPEPVAAEALMYTVRVGDNLTRLSARNGTTIQAIADANGIRNRNLIYIGQSISIPGPEPVVADQPGVANQLPPATPTSDNPHAVDDRTRSPLAAESTRPDPSPEAASATTPQPSPAAAESLTPTAARPVPTRDPAAPADSLLPTTQPGLSASEGVFLITPTDDGSDAVYFIAQNTRHSTLPGDLQRERELNPLWPAWLVDRAVVLAFAEGAPVGAARTGLLNAGVADGEPIAVDASIMYTVRAGDNLTRLSGRYGTSVGVIVEANGIRNPNLIYVGQPITIPRLSATSEPAS